MSDPNLDDQPTDAGGSSLDPTAAGEPEVEEPKEDAEGLGRDVEDPPV